MYVKVVDELALFVGIANLHPLKTVMMDKFLVFNPNLQKKLLAEYDQKSKLKSQEWSKLKSDKKSELTILFGQCNNATRTKIALDPNYKTDCKDGNLISFLSRVRTVCYGN